MMGERRGTRAERDVEWVGDRWNLAAILCAILLAAAISLFPLVAETSSTVDSSGAVVTETTRRSLLESEGAGVVVIALIPVLITAVPMLGRSRSFRRRARIGASIALAILALLGALSIGVFILPTLVLMVIAAGKSGWRVRADPARDAGDRKLRRRR